MGELVERLRNPPFADRIHMADLHTEAADRIEALEARCERYREALGSIARNSCCDKCQEAAMVARAALEEAGNGR